MKFLKRLDSQLLTALIVMVASIIGFAATSFLLNSVNKDIPFGFLLSGGVIASIYFLSHYLLAIDKRRGSTTFSIIAISLRLVLVMIALIFLFLLNYKWDINLFNVFVFIGIYTFAVIVFGLINIFNKGKE